MDALSNRKDFAEKWGPVADERIRNLSKVDSQTLAQLAKIHDSRSPLARPTLALPLPCACCGPKKTRSKLHQSQVRVIPTVGILSDINSDILSGILSEMFVVTYYLTFSLS